MPTSTDLSLNDRIALAKGWRRACYRQRTPHPNRCEKELGPWCETCPLNSWAEWIDPAGKPTIRPDFVGTLEGLAGLMRELNQKTFPHCYWTWGYDPNPDWFPGWNRYVDEGCVGQELGRYYVERGTQNTSVINFESPPDRPGDCVGEAYLSVKEAADASTTD